MEIIDKKTLPSSETSINPFSQAFTSENFENGYLRNELPEFFALKNTIENSHWHNHESVFDHTLKVLAEFEKLIATLPDKVTGYLDQKVDTHTRKEILTLSILFHDIAKSDTLVQDGEISTCPNHEAVGAEKVKPILNRFSLSDQEKEIIVSIVRYHNDIHTLINPKNQNIPENLEKLKAERQDIFVELLLLGMADTIGSDLEKNLPENFQFRIDLYKQIIDSY